MHRGPGSYALTRIIQCAPTLPDPC